MDNQDLRLAVLIDADNAPRSALRDIMAEAAVYGIPVLVGPNNGKFREAQDLLRAGGCLEVTDAATYGAAMDRLLSDKAFLSERGRIAGEYIAKNAGAADAVFSHVKF